MATFYFDDMIVGQKFTSSTLTITAEDIKTFARQFDPQPFHMDEVAAADSMFKGLAASGWHTAALTMRLIVTGDTKLAGGFIGMGVDELKWLMPVRPGDTLQVESEILALTPSKSRPQGTAKIRAVTINQMDAEVQTWIANLLVPRRPA